MLARALTKADFDHIVQVIDQWSAGPSAALVHPVFFHELGELAKVVEHDPGLVGFLFGFISSTDPTTGYIHLLGIDPDFRRRGVGRLLFQHFEQDCRARNCLRVKSMAMPGNDTLTAFHRSLGWNSILVDDYAGPARSRIVFEKRL